MENKNERKQVTVKCRRFELWGDFKCTEDVIVPVDWLSEHGTDHVLCSECYAGVCDGFVARRREERDE